ncbi:immunity 49 family protein [Pyxidicoccus fallax]|uniref:Immunity 49 family protein n=1 Tax=Pyxidicoccus fallax TaxID=394095 RepID=A0A848LII3_9BACT|nr:Imm49 family immunity protein [Pyxidicoccus fallax]NMO17518.1 immunity 49 family protein [Pyxidicoccus fallax]NPC81903.1 immunity 49 family protein [Pyxidicoccus fallax]
MGRMSLREHEELALGRMAILTADLERGKRSAADRERILFHLSRNARIAAIAGLLVRADTSGFNQWLRRSASWRLQALRERKQEERPVSQFTCTGEVAPLCDAIASGADTTARELTALSADTWLEGAEFEDDFHYGRVLQALLTGNEGAADVRERLSELARSSGEDEPPRLKVCQALLALDAKSFDESLRQLIDERAAWFRARLGGLAPEDSRFETDRFVFIEGLALVRLAELRDLPVEEEYPFLPGLARLEASSPQDSVR